LLTGCCDAERIEQIAIDTNMFSVGEVGCFDKMLSGFFDSSLADHRWFVVEDSRGRVIAAANDAPEPFADRMGNLYSIAVVAEEQGRGLGDLLIEHVERELRSRGDAVARVLIVEASSTGQYVRTREFYRNHGFGKVARIRQFYGPADDKVVFWKSLAESAQRVTASHVCTEDRLSVRRSSCQGFGQCPTTSTDVAGAATVPLMDDGFRTRLHRLR